MSTVIAVFNGESYLAEAIQSALGQTYRRQEVVVVDDGSTDTTPQIIARFGDAVRAIRQPNQGVSAARNVGIDEARGDLIAFLDADDVWLPTKLERQVDRFVRNPQLGLVYCGYFVTDTDLRARYAVPALRAHRRIMRCFTLDAWGIGLPITGLMPREVVEGAGGFSESMSTSADVDFLARIAREEVDAVPAPLALYRTHRAQMHRDPALVERDMELFFEHAEVRRLLGPPGIDQGRANLHLRLGIRKLQHGRIPAALEDFARVVALKPSRLVVSPLLALVRRGIYGRLAQILRPRLKRELRLMRPGDG